MFCFLYKKFFQYFRGVKFGRGVKICWPCNLYNCFLDDYSFCGPYTEIQNDCYIGKRTRISSHTFICAHTAIGNDCFIGHGVQTCNDRNPKANNKDWTCEPITIQQDSFVGSGSVIGPNVVIYKGGKVGCGSNVLKNIGADETWFGNPAKKKDDNDRTIGFK